MNSAGITVSRLLLCWRCFSQTLNHTNISPHTNYNKVSQTHFNRNIPYACFYFKESKPILFSSFLRCDHERIKMMKVREENMQRACE